MNIDIKDLAERLSEIGIKADTFDSERSIEEIIEFLNDSGFFDELQNELMGVENAKH
jgi:hypothetical protein